jgi:ribose transport system substrate-binding protein
MRSKDPRLYNIPILSKGMDLLEVLQSSDRPASLQELVRRTAIPKSTLFRMLHTYVNRGYVARTSEGLYQVLHRFRKVRFGFVGNDFNDSFCRIVRDGLLQAATNSGIELLVLDSVRSGQKAIQNVSTLIESKCDVVVVQNAETLVAPIIGHVLAEAGIPLIAVDVPHPNAVYFGVDNYRVGLEAGSLLLQYADRYWQGEADEVLVVHGGAARFPAADRVCGALYKIRSRLPNITVVKGRHKKESRERLRSPDAMTRLLRSLVHKRARLLAIALTEAEAITISDAVQAFRGQAEIAVVVCGAQVNTIRETDLYRFAGCVFPDPVNYGRSITAIGMAIHRGEPVQPYYFGDYHAIEMSMSHHSEDSQVVRQHGLCCDVPDLLCHSLS